MSILTNVLHVK